MINETCFTIFRFCDDLTAPVWFWPLCEVGILKTIKIPFSCEEKKVKQCCKNRRGLSGVEELHKIGIFPYMSRLDISCSSKVNYSQELQALDFAIATSLKSDKNWINNPTNIHTNNCMTIWWTIRWTIGGAIRKNIRQAIGGKIGRKIGWTNNWIKNLNPIIRRTIRQTIRQPMGQTIGWPIRQTISFLDNRSKPNI